MEGTYDMKAVAFFSFSALLLLYLLLAFFSRTMTPLDLYNMMIIIYCAKALAIYNFETHVWSMHLKWGLFL